MILVKNRLIPFGKFIAMNLFGVVFVRKDKIDKMSTGNFARLLRHESIHTAQIVELLFVGFYVIYIIEWIYRLLFHTKNAYKGISFEVEANSHEDEIGYLDGRRHFEQWRRKD